MIDRSEALLYHEELVRRFGGSQGVRDEGILDAALHRPFATFGGVDLFPTPESKAAAIMHGIITGHPFIDGNKRTGYALARLILQVHGLDIEATEDERYDLVIQVATGQLDADGVRAWLEPRVKQVRA
ncbi:MAG: type II toxin-antitoxin system death-on-curing family toxin [Flavobacteriales bacterium]|nr:type II toxin-antitoxin system death-on-curing family toxin [Flavobacteriales bacterium]MEB2342388.1 type II toxin-antitoxin system death-on-curing family toxin [Flavobacteriia bacterium]